MLKIILLILSVTIMGCNTLSQISGIVEKSRNIPVAYDVDVVVVGGNTRAVSAAMAAKKKGATVFLMSERPYLGSDMCATYRLWLEKGENLTTPLAEAIFDKGTPTPLEVKMRLDDALLKSKVDFLYGCYPTDVLIDKGGNLSGIVMANRSGRQAVLAKVIIDATDRAVVARMAGAKFADYPAGPQKFKRIVLGGKPNKEAKLLPITFDVVSDSRRKSGTENYKVYEYDLEIPMKDGTWKSFANADRIARDLTWQEGQADASEILFQIPPDPVKGRTSQSGPWHGADKVDLNSLNPANIDGIYLLGGCADISREAAQQLLRPVQGMELGERVGKAAASEALKRETGPVNELTVSSECGGNDIGNIGEMLNGLRSKPGMKPLPVVKSPDRSLPVLGEYDVVIVGGGTGGAPAGISAARAGAKTLVIEYLDGLGGVGTLGRISKYYHGNRVGFTKEIDQAVGRGSWNIEKKMEWFRKEIVKAGGEIWFHTLGCGSVLKNNRFVGVVVATPLGRGVIKANTIIDSTGNSVIPACAGIPCQEINSANISVQGTGLPTFSPGVGYLNGDWTFCDDDDVLDMWRMFVVAKYKISKQSRARFKSPFDLGQLINTRARRRIIGDVVITPMDIINKRTFPDTITVAKSNFDNHGFSSHVLFMVTPPHRGGLVGNIPYRALMPKGYDGLLVTGLGISAHGDAMPVLRMQPDVQNQGYAAGYAAAMAAKNDSSVRKIDVRKLQKHLVKKEIIPESMLTQKDSYPFTDEEIQKAVIKMGENYDGISVILTDLSRSIPMLKNAYKKSTDDEVKLRYAHVLGMFGNDTGIRELIKKLNKSDWDKGWNFRGMGQYGRTTSYIDNLVISLGRTGNNKGLDTLIGMLKKLTPKSEFSHYRAVAMALESLGNHKAAKPLADLLNMEGVRGHAFVNIQDAIDAANGNFADTSARNSSLRELILARALYRCGDFKGLGQQILKNYAKDFRGHYATHAKAVLKDSSVKD